MNLKTFFPLLVTNITEFRVFNLRRFARRVAVQALMRLETTVKRDTIIHYTSTYWPLPQYMSFDVRMFLSGAISLMTNGDQSLNTTGASEKSLS